jgi:hypothetical protein
VDLPDVAPLASFTPARELAIPVEPALSPLFPDAGLQRGHVVGCRGVAARSAALALAVRAVSDGAWLAVVGIDDFGIEAATELGIPAARVVAVAAATPQEWAERITAAADGFELILTVPPSGAERMMPTVMRRVRQRLRARGSVLVLVPRGVGDSGFAGVDVEIVTTGGQWLGIGAGHGRLIARRVAVRSSGRRVPRPITVDCWLPGPDGRVDVVQSGRVDVVGEPAEASSLTPASAGGSDVDVVTRAS